VGVLLNCSLLDTSSPSAFFDNKLRRTMTSPYFSTTTNATADLNHKTQPSFAHPVVIPFSCSSIQRGP